MFLLEAFVNNVPGSVKETMRMFAPVDHSGRGLLIDPTNHVGAPNIDAMDYMLYLVFDPLSPHIRIAHARDGARSGADQSERHAFIDDAEALARLSCRGVGDIMLNAPGTGVPNCDLPCKRRSEQHPNLPVIVEPPEQPDMPRAKTFFDRKFREPGV